MWNPDGSLRPPRRRGVGPRPTEADAGCVFGVAVDSTSCGKNTLLRPSLSLTPLHFDTHTHSASTPSSTSDAGDAVVAGAPSAWAPTSTRHAAPARRDLLAGTAPSLAALADGGGVSPPRAPLPRRSPGAAAGGLAAGVTTRREEAPFPWARREAAAANGSAVSEASPARAAKVAELTGSVNGLRLGGRDDDDASPRRRARRPVAGAPPGQLGPGAERQAAAGMVAAALASATAAAGEERRSGLPPATPEPSRGAAESHALSAAASDDEGLRTPVGKGGAGGGGRRRPAWQT